MHFFNRKGNFSTLNLQFADSAQSKMSINGIIVFLGMDNTRLERKILIILDFENGFLPTYLPLCNVVLVRVAIYARSHLKRERSVNAI